MPVVADTRRAVVVGFWMLGGDDDDHTLTIERWPVVAWDVGTRAEERHVTPVIACGLPVTYCLEFVDPARDVAIWLFEEDDVFTDYAAACAEGERRELKNSRGTP